MKVFSNRILWIKIIHWTLFALMIAEIISGLGILYGSAIESIIPISKVLSYKIHTYLVGPLIIALALHILILKWNRKLRMHRKFI